MQNRIVFFVISLIVMLFYSLDKPNIDNFSIYAVFLFVNLLYDFFLKIGTSVPIKQLILLIAFVQWAIAPFLSYHYYSESIFYYMQIPESQYMGYIFPALLLFAIGLLFPSNVSRKLNLTNILEEFSQNEEIIKKRGYFLFYLGIFSTVFGPFFPSIISFALFLTSKLIFIGAFYLFAVRVRFKYIYLVGAFLPVIISAGQSSVFHDMFLWGGFLFMIYGLLGRIGFLKKMVIVLMGVGTFFFVQLIKQDYRGAINEDLARDRTELLTKVASEKLNQDLEQGFFQNQVDRLNQGWIIARIMYVVPLYEPFAEGETISEGLKAALLPRFLLPNKVVSGGYYFERFTGYKLIGTSMNLGLVGEAYANYGELGGMIFMLIFGLFINVSLNVIFKKSLHSKEYLLWIPFLFLYMIKAEDDFTTMINQFVKALYVMIAIFWLMNKLYPKNQIDKLDETNSLG